MSAESAKVTDRATKAARRRKYEKRRRAEKEAATRLRITEAAVKLHGSVGAARTTISGVAVEAGVQRGTVYRHFPDEAALFEACSSHWIAQNPPPDPEGWAKEDDGDARLHRALDEVYSYYERTAEMIENNLRDVATVPALRPSMELFSAYLEAAREALVAGRPERGPARRTVRASIGHALAFTTWRSLTREQGLSRAQAVELMAALVGASGASPGRRTKPET